MFLTKPADRKAHAYYIKHHCVVKPDSSEIHKQIEVNKEHRSFKRILWAFNFEDDPHTYDLNTVTYGVRPATYLVLRTIKIMPRISVIVTPTQHVFFSRTQMLTLLQVGTVMSAQPSCSPH